MQSTMQDVPLLVSRILRHGSTVHGAAQVVTWAGEEGARRRSFAEVGDRAAQLAHALHDELGVGESDVIGTLMWNNCEHLEAYLAIPSMGAVLHTLNLRLPPEQLVWIANHAADPVILVDGSLLPMLAAALPQLPAVRHVVVNGPGDRSVLDSALGSVPDGAGITVHEYEELIAGRPTTYDWPDLDERQAAALCYTSGTTGEPKGVVYSHRSVYLHSLQVNGADAFGMNPATVCLPVVPMFHDSGSKRQGALACLPRTGAAPVPPMR
ncbi:AMP-binding protein, partial [Streptomyces sp. NPDC057654]|uniref:AMP-binding protein n=1 Tax=Streptomyces sp. NPDC057654 TaxID=3346196 RepID=UPI00369C22DE